MSNDPLKLRVGKYVLVVQSHDEGCGDTIGCGQRVVPLEGATQEEAFLEAQMALTDVDGYGSWLEDSIDDLFLETAHVMRVEHVFDINRLRKTVTETAVETRERAEYLRLKQKYG